MSNLSQFFGGEQPPKTIVNGFSTSGYTRATVPNGSGIKKILSGSMPTAGTLYTPAGFPLTGPGVVSFLDVYENDNAVSRSLRCKVTIDGVVAFDSTSTTAASAVGAGAEIIGTTNTSSAYIPDPMPFKTSFLVELASSNGTETDKMTVGIVHRTT